MEKEHQPDSMATITMKPEYPPSEVYSTSEPPPAYRRGPSSAVQIARIAALTVVAASFILGSFILASSWVAARASCHQLDQIDAMLDKELALEGRAYGNDGLMADEPLPVGNAHALHGAPPPPAPAQPAAHTKEDALNQAESKIEEDKLQKIDDEKSASPNSVSSESSESDSSAEEEDELDARPLLKLPVQFDLDELAGAFLANNQKGRMNCMVERRRDDPAERRFPFNILGAFAPRAAHAERIAIICHGGDEMRPMIPEPQSQVFAFPLSGPVRLPLRPHPERAPAQDPRMPFAPLSHRPAPFPMPMPWDSSEEQMNVPREMRIHVQRVITIPTSHNMPPPPEGMGPFAPPPQETLGPFALPPPPQPQLQHDQSESNVLHQFVPQPAPTQDQEQPEIQKMQMEGAPLLNIPWGLMQDELRALHRPDDAQRRDQQVDNDMQEVKTIVNTLAAAVEAEAAEAQNEQHQAPAPEAPAPAHPPRAPRTLLLPQDMPMDERPHYMQPRSVRSVHASPLEPKRVKRCACDCA